jgi:light-regulated signal transduction histidine kinase (bacteriophytochrome)
LNLVTIAVMHQAAFLPIAAMTLVAFPRHRQRSPLLDIKSGAARDGEQIHCVRDKGAGFDMTHADRLLDGVNCNDASADFPGAGIGLATVKRIIQRNGGRVWATAALDVGAADYFTLGPEAA